MLLLVLFAFIAGVITILSPCILPLLPIILSSAAGSGRMRPLGVVVGFVASFTFFTLFLSTIVSALGISADFLRSFSIVVLVLFGVALILPRFQIVLEQVFAKLSKYAPTGSSPGFSGGLIIGLSLGLLWTPCVGPILASVISLAIAGTVTAQAFFITLAYALGTAVPMFAIMIAGSTALQKVPWLTRNSARIQRIFGVVMILTGLAIFFQFDRKFQTYVLDTFPNYGTGLTKIEDNEAVQRQLGNMSAEILAEIPKYKAPEIIPGGRWFNLPEGQSSLSLKDLKGKVVLVDFWTYTCINCIRTLPYIKDWYEKYHDMGFEVIGVHTPEFAFEKNAVNLQKAIDDFGLKYPIIQDNDYATWKAYDNHYWPAKYFIDKDGYVRAIHTGEHQYAESERFIQKLLMETGLSVDETVSTEAPEKNFSQTPETYLGYARMNPLQSVQDIMRDKKNEYTRHLLIQNNQFSINGVWTVGPEAAVPAKGATLTFSFDAKDVYLVMKSKDGAPGRIRVLLDGREVGQGNAGESVSGGEVSVEDNKLYSLIKLPTGGKHTLKIEILDDNLELYSFTFG